MTIFTVQERTETLIGQLCLIWKESVKATHFFLSDEEIEGIAPYVPTALKEIPRLVVAVDDRTEPCGFMGIDGGRLEMLFIHPKNRGCGLGKQLILYGIEHFSVNEVGVNEQNPQAKGFYEHMGFQVYGRSELDEQGNPYPILYMKLVQ